jgi:hypothetical protein
MKLCFINVIKVFWDVGSSRTEADTARNKLCYDADISIPPGGIQNRVPRTSILKSGSHYDQIVYV